MNSGERSVETRVIKSSPAQEADCFGEVDFPRAGTCAAGDERRSGQLAFARDDLVYMGLRNGRAAAGIFFGFDFEKQIQTREITHEALTNRRMAARIRSPLSPTATQTAFRVTIRQTPSVNSVEIAILESFLANENSISDCRVPSRKL